MRVKANWNVGYKNKLKRAGETFECDPGWGKEKAKQGKVEILEEEADEENEHNNTLDIDITEYTVEEAKEVIEDIEDPEVIKALIEQEKEREEPRKTLIQFLVEKYKALEE